MNSQSGFENCFPVRCIEDMPTALHQLVQFKYQGEYWAERHEGAYRVWYGKEERDYEPFNEAAFKRYFVEV